MLSQAIKVDNASALSGPRFEMLSIMGAENLKIPRVGMADESSNALKMGFNGVINSMRGGRRPLIVLYFPFRQTTPTRQPEAYI
jgi:hypothetical protein